MSMLTALWLDVSSVAKWLFLHVGRLSKLNVVVATRKGQWLAVPQARSHRLPIFADPGPGPMAGAWMKLTGRLMYKFLCKRRPWPAHSLSTVICTPTAYLVHICACTPTTIGPIPLDCRHHATVILQLEWSQPGRVGRWAAVIRPPFKVQVVRDRLAISWTLVCRWRCVLLLYLWAAKNDLNWDNQTIDSGVCSTYISQAVRMSRLY